MKLGKTWLQNFRNRHPKVSSKFGSNLDRQRALAGSPGPIIDYFSKLKKVLMEYNFLSESVCDVGGGGFVLGVLNCAKGCLQGRAVSSTSNTTGWNT